METQGIDRGMIGMLFDIVNSASKAGSIGALRLLLCNADPAQTNQKVGSVGAPCLLLCNADPAQTESKSRLDWRAMLAALQRRPSADRIKMTCKFLMVRTR